MIRVLADPSRHAVYEELAGGTGPATIGELAERLDLHPSTVRLHLEKLRDAGLVGSAPDRHGSVGRPHLLWSARSNAPALGLEPDGMRMLAHLLADLAAIDPVASRRAEVVGRRRGAEMARDAGIGTDAAQGGDPGPDRPAPGGGDRLAAALAELARLGFDPSLDPAVPSAPVSVPTAAPGAPAPAINERRVIAFAACPFRELAVVYPDLVCQLHQGITAALLEGAGAALEGFSTLVDPDPCRAEISVNA